MHYSTGLAASILGSTGMTGASALGTGVIDILSGPMPTDANDAQTGTLLVRITKASGAWVAGTATNGLVYDVSGATAGIHSGDTWSGVAVASGTAGYARAKGNAADNLASSTTLVRCDLTVSAGGGAECNLSHLDITSGETVSVNSCAITQPRA